MTCKAEPSIAMKAFCKENQLRKSIIFFSTGASVDFHCDLLVGATWPSRAGVPRGKEMAPALKKLGRFVGLAKDAKKMRAEDTDDEEEEEEDVKESGVKMFAKTQILKLHGSLSKEERAGYIADFLKVPGGILLASDAASRGLDFPRIDWIIQYDPPQRSNVRSHVVTQCYTMLLHSAQTHDPN